MHKITIKIEVTIEQEPTPDQLKDVRWAVQTKIKELEYDDEMSPKGNLIKGAFVVEEN